eukprot:CAMPEP_0178377218 /NCGR_PEP_ID=MMETSP0689_2-20121128/3807_1 /TAXON_ID=160604 /ORGANISM="Amphidinium massartii, Strain CS-259" /LENGTH=1012 /DNA_ID=CAMNT_0019997269 /DNA_START=47 /DNA_END=3085 /DNA_ORIENTATION=+
MQTEKLTLQQCNGAGPAETVAAISAAEGNLRDAIASLGSQVNARFNEVQRLILELQPHQVHGLLPQHGTASQLNFEVAHATSGSQDDMERSAPSLALPLLQQQGSQVSSARSSVVVELRREFVLASEEENIARLRNFAVTATRPRSVSVDRFFVGSSLEIPTLKVLHPASRKRIVWDVCCMCVICIQIFYLPFALVWQDEVVAVDGLFLACTTLFWTVDLALHFITGYYTSDGEVEMRLHFVVRRYIRTWFSADLLCVCTDLFNLASELALTQVSDATAARALHIVKLQRVLRAFIIVRMMRASKLLYEYVENRISSSGTVFLRSVQFAVLILWTAHVVACAWFALGRYVPTRPNESTWIDVPVEGSFGYYTFADRDVWYQFTSSYHWALAQITLGGLDINPTNPWERLLAILCNLFGLFFGGVVVSILSSTMIGVRETNRHHATKMRTLREFLLQHGIRLGIRLRVVRQVTDRMQQHGKILCEKDVSALNVLSTALLRDLRYSLYSHFVLQHPLLHSWRLLQAESIKLFCNEGIFFIALLPDDELFATGSTGMGAYMLTQGGLSYSQAVAEGYVDEEVLEELEEGTWISEAAWWCHWRHVGTSAALRPATLLSVPTDTVMAAMKRDPVVCAITIEYGIRFHRYIVQECDGFTDTSMSSGDFNVLCNLPREVNVILGMASLEQMWANPQLRWRLDRIGDMKLLEDEIREGESLLLLDSHGVPRRRVALTLLQLGRQEDDGSQTFLTEVAIYDHETETWKPNLHPPSAQQSSGETHHQAFERILDTLFGASHWTPLEWLRETENQDSHQNLGVGTEYIKSIGVLQLTDEMEADLQLHAVPVRGGSGQIETPASNGTITVTQPIWTSFAAPTWSTGEDLLTSLLRATEKVHILGQHHKGLYMWMTKDIFSRLQKHESILKRLVAQLLVKCTLQEEMLRPADASAGCQQAKPAQAARQTEMQPCAEVMAQTLSPFGQSSSSMTTSNHEKRGILVGPRVAVHSLPSPVPEAVEYEM